MSRLFRQVSLERLSSPEQLDYVMRIVSPRGWLALLGAGALLAVAILWAYFGTVPELVHGQGILISPEGINTLVSPAAGQVTELSVQVGDFVATGQTVARITPRDGTAPSPIISSFSGYVVELEVNRGSPVESGARLMTIEIGDKDKRNLEGIIYVSPSEGKQVKPGMQVQLEPVTTKHEEYGYLLGQVLSVSPFPVTQQGMLHLIGNEELVRTFSADGAPIEIHIKLIPAQTPSGYEWSSRTGPPEPLSSGTLATALIRVNEQRVLSLIFPIVQ